MQQSICLAHKRQHRIGPTGEALWRPYASNGATRTDDDDDDEDDDEKRMTTTTIYNVSMF